MQKISGYLMVDMHTHSSGVSRCSRVTPEELVLQKKQQGYDGMVLTNHCQQWYYLPEEHEKYVENCIAEYHKAKAYGEKIGFRVFLGIEVTVLIPQYYDMLIYGATEEMLRNSPCLYQMSHQELFEYCKRYGALLIHAHPFRLTYDGRYIGPADQQYLHGVEINCTPKDLVLKEQLLQFAKESEMLVTCGTDYHAPDRTFRGGAYIPDTVYTATDLAAYLKTAKSTKLFLEDEVLEVAVPTILQSKL